MDEIVNGGSLMEQDASKWLPGARTKEIAAGGNGLRMDQIDYQIGQLSQELASLNKESAEIQKRRLQILEKMDDIKLKIDKLIREFKVPEFLATQAKNPKTKTTMKDVERELAKLSPEARERALSSIAKGKEGK